MIAVFLILWAAGFILAAGFSKRGAAIAPAAPSKSISLIIPARNEAHNLPKLLESVFSQSVRPHEVIVVDDASSDETAAVARRHGAAVIASEPLPGGWRGKTWACHQGARAATGGFLLFMDADTWFEPGGLARMLAQYPGGAFSVGPHHAVRDLREDLSLFFNFSMAAGTMPGGLSGQVLLVNRADYEKAGGHASVRGRVLENFRLAEEFRAAGVPVRCVPGRGMVSSRMYPGGLRELTEGWTKGFASGAGKTPPRVLLLVVAWMTALMLPPLAGAVTGDWLPWIAAYFLCVGQVAWIAGKLGSFGRAGILLYPLPLVFFFAVFGWSACRSGKKVSWKGREIDAD